ncbi:hypothetical protein [Phocaeicola sp.]
MLNAVKHLKIHSYHSQILRKAQNDNTKKTVKFYPFVMLNTVKHLEIHSYHSQILRKAQNDKAKRQ